MPPECPGRGEDKGVEMSRILWVLAALVAGLLVAGGVRAGELALVNHQGGFFKIQVPAGWQVYTAGQCAEFALVARDPARPLRQVFYFGSVGPFYLSPQQKQMDYNYVRSGGYAIAWLEMPVVAPLSPAGFLQQFQHIASTNLARRFMPQAPRLQNLQVVSVQNMPSPISGGTCALVRGVFTRQGQVGQGLFVCTVAPFMPFTGGPGGGTGFAFLLTGITAPKAEFAALEPILARSIGSLSLDPGYLGRCRQTSQAAFQGVLRAGQTLRQTSDMIMEGWQRRNRRQDVMAEKRSDAILGFERVYDPDTGETYQVQPGFWDQYRRNRERFQMGNLQVVPNTRHDLWTRAPRRQQDIR